MNGRGEVELALQTLGSNHKKLLLIDSCWLSTEVNKQKHWKASCFPFPVRNSWLSVTSSPIKTWLLAVAVEKI